MNKYLHMRKVYDIIHFKGDFLCAPMLTIISNGGEFAEK